jgi:hypothetical protein
MIRSGRQAFQQGNHPHGPHLVCAASTPPTVQVGTPLRNVWPGYIVTPADISGESSREGLEPVLALF